jgi:O-Antigen ligase
MSSLAPETWSRTVTPAVRPKSTLLGILARASVPEYLAAGSITLVRAGESFGHKTVLQAVVMGIFLYAILWAIPRQPRGSFLNPRVVLVVLFVASVALALMRGANHATYGNLTSAGGKAVLYSLVALFGVSLITTAEDAETRDRRLFAVALALPLYAVINLLLHYAGMQNPNPAGATAGTSSQLASLIGISSGRQVFPLTTSINLYSIVVGAAVAAIGVLRIRAPQWCPRWLVGLVTVICVYELLVGDSRTEVAVALGVVLVFALFKNFKGSRWVPVVIPALPLIVLGLLHVVAATGIGNAFNRSTPGQNQFGSVVSGTGRVDIWHGAWQVLKHLQPQELFGWGAGGHITSGASLHYAYVFPRDPLGYTEFTHSLPIQIVLDEGIVGLLLLIAALWMTFAALRRHIKMNPSSPAIALVAILIVFVACGATEVSITYYAEEALVMTLLIMGVAAGLAVRPVLPLQRQLRSEPLRSG